MARKYYDPKLPIDLVFEDPHNERRTYSRVQMILLKNSIAARGLIVPIAVQRFTKREMEEILGRQLSGHNEFYYLVIWGNRRTRVAKELGMKTIKAKIYLGLTEAERVELQIIENATKSEIPKCEMAQAIWELYLWHVGNIIEGPDYALQLWGQYRDQGWFNLPEPFKQALPIIQFTAMANRNEDTIMRAMHYTNAHRQLANQVAQGQDSYARVAELGRIKDKNQQIIFYARFRRSGHKDNLVNDGEKPVPQNAEELSRRVTDYLREQAEQANPKSFELTMSRDNGSDLSDFTAQIVAARRFCHSFTGLIEIDPGILLHQGFSTDYLGSIEQVIERHLTTVNDFLVSLDPELLTSIKAKRHRPRLSWQERILAGDRVATTHTLHDLLAGAIYKMVYLSQVDPDPNNPRKSFPADELNEMATTMKKYGVLQPPLLRPLKNKKYQIVAGHRRLRAAEIAGLKRIPCLVVELSDALARIIQLDEDFYERVILFERAGSLLRLYQLKVKQRQRPYSMEQFAHDHQGLGVLTVLAALKFAQLPRSIQELHEFGLLGYTSAVMLHELQNDQAMQFELALESILLNFTCRQMQERIKELQDTSQTTLPGFLDAAQHKKGRRRLLIDQLAKQLGPIDLLSHQPQRYHKVGVIE
jgi:ParB family chromosome partitioning protein